MDVCEDDLRSGSVGRGGGGVRHLECVGEVERAEGVDMRDMMRAVDCMRKVMRGEGTTEDAFMFNG